MEMTAIMLIPRKTCSRFGRIMSAGCAKFVGFTPCPDWKIQWSNGGRQAYRIRMNKAFLKYVATKLLVLQHSFHVGCNTLVGYKGATFPKTLLWSRVAETQDTSLQILWAGHLHQRGQLHVCSWSSRAAGQWEVFQCQWWGLFQKMDQ